MYCLEHFNMDISQIKLNPNNPRTIKDDKFKKLCKSLKENPEFLDARPIVVKDGVIYGGNMRWLALKEIGIEIKSEWIKDVTGWTDKAIRKFIVVDNIPYGDNDWDILANQYEKEELEDWGMDVDKWTDDEVVEDEVPEVTENPKSKLGEIYQLGRHRVMCGDSTKIEDVERLMDGKKADMVFTDPPYGMKLDADYSGMKGWHTGKKYDKVIGDNADFNSDFINNIFSIFKDTKEKFLFGGDYYVDLLPNFGKDGCWIVWDKRVDESKDKMFGSGFEMLWSQEKHQRRILRGQWAGFMGDREARNRVHPTQKPTKILSEILQEYSSSEQVITDLFLGSGSTLIACEQTNRICYGCEIDPKYVDVIRKRYAKFIGKEEEWETVTPRVN